MPTNYILDEDGRTPVPCGDVLEWSRSYDIEKRRVGYDVLDDGRVVSTVFLGIDHNFSGQGPPVLFETMAFPGEDDFGETYCERYSTWAEAEAGHARVAAALREGRDPDDA